MENNQNNNGGCGRTLGIIFVALIALAFFVFFADLASYVGVKTAVLLLVGGAIALLFFVLGAPYSFWGWRR